MNVSVIGGTGYVGLITGVGLAEMGHTVMNVDIDSTRVDILQSGTPSVFECELEPLLRKNLEAGRLRFTTDIEAGAKHAEVIFIAVGTPSQRDGHVDLSQVIRVAEHLLPHMESYKVVVVKSTVPVGTVELIGSILRREKQEDLEFNIVANPEFLREGKALYDFFYPDRIIIGTHSEKAKRIMRELYARIITGKVAFPSENRPPHRRGPVPVVETGITSAQLVKYAANAFLAMRISFINEIAALCERLGCDVRDVVRGVGYDGRIGHAYLEPGLGFGGPCLEKDLRALLKIAQENCYEPKLLRAVLERNEEQLNEVVAKLKEIVGYFLYQRTLAVFGLAFKAGTNDVRNSLGLKLIERLEGEGAIVHAHDPVAIPAAHVLKPALSYFEDPYQAVDHAEALIIAADWPHFRELDFERIKECMARPCVLDGRNLLDPEGMRELGFIYTGMGIGEETR